MYLIIAIITIFAFLWYLVVSPKARTMPRYSEQEDTVNSFSTMKSAYLLDDYRKKRDYLVPYRCDGETGPINL